MGKVITVWGSPGSGKSMFSCILAKALTRDKRKAIIINAELSVPMLPVWLPEQIIQTNASVGQVLSSVEIDTSLVASHVTVLKSYPFIGLMGYSAGENPLSYPEIKYAMVLQLVNAAARLVDFVILDCSSNMTNVFTPAAIESGDLVIRLLTLAVRLYGNMFAGHMILGIFAIMTQFFILDLISFANPAGVAAIAWAVFLVAMYALECLVAFLQAYVFSVLTAVYVGLAQSEH